MKLNYTKKSIDITANELIEWIAQEIKKELNNIPEENGDRYKTYLSLERAINLTGIVVNLLDNIDCDFEEIGIALSYNFNGLLASIIKNNILVFNETVLESCKILDSVVEYLEEDKRVRDNPPQYY